MVSTKGDPLNASLPTRLRDGLYLWQVEENTPHRFYAVRRLKWRGASMDHKALAVFGLLLMVGVTLLAFEAAMQIPDLLRRLVTMGPRPQILREGSLYFVLILGWTGLVYFVFPRQKVLEARPGYLRFGTRAWRADQVARIELRSWRRTTDTLWSAEVPGSTTTLTGVDVLIVQPAGRPRKAWSHAGDGRRIFSRWVRHMAHIAGVPFRPSKKS